ncbi:MAG: YqaJ viral recombinase family protein [Bacteroidales bacterium]|nr:YqaJ viral recombinase family protein [Bacteroidales bacterium]
MKHYNVEQNTDEWFALRAGKITSSIFSVLFMKETTEGFKDLINQTAYERLLGPIPDKWEGNGATEAGHEWEQYGKEQYEKQTFMKIHPGGFFEYDDYIGGSPDGIIGKDGLIEIKTHDTKNFLRRVNDFQVRKNEHWQVQGQMFVSDRKWVDLVVIARNIELKPIIHRVEINQKAQEQLSERLGYAKELIDEKVELLRNYMA